MDNLATHETPLCWRLRVQKYSIFDGFGEAYLCILKITEVFVDNFISFHFLGASIPFILPEYA